MIQMTIVSSVVRSKKKMRVRSIESILRERSLQMKMRYYGIHERFLKALSWEKFTPKRSSSVVPTSMDSSRQAGSAEVIEVQVRYRFLGWFVQKRYFTLQNSSKGAERTTARTSFFMMGNREVQKYRTRAKIPKRTG